MTNQQLEALWAVVVEGSDDGAVSSGKGKHDLTVKLKLDPKGETVRGATFEGVCGAIVHKDERGKISGELYATAGAFNRAWKHSKSTGRAPWK
jgi:hypothetical protein